MALVRPARRRVRHVGLHRPRRALRTNIDPSARGNVGRYLNHSCAPNLASTGARGIHGFADATAEVAALRDVAEGDACGNLHQQIFAQPTLTPQNVEGLDGFVSQANEIE